MKYQTSCKIYFRDNNLFGLRIVLVYHVTWLNWNRTVYFTPLMWRRNLTKYFTSFNLSITRLSSSVVSLSIFKFSLFSSPLHLFHSHSPYLPRCIFSFLSLYSDLFFLYSINFSLLFFASSFSPQFSFTMLSSDCEQFSFYSILLFDFPRSLSSNRSHVLHLVPFSFRFSYSNLFGSSLSPLQFLDLHFTDQIFLHFLFFSWFMFNVFLVSNFPGIPLFSTSLSFCTTNFSPFLLHFTINLSSSIFYNCSFLAIFSSLFDFLSLIYSSLSHLSIPLHSSFILSSRVISSIYHTLF